MTLSMRPPGSPWAKRLWRWLPVGLWVGLIWTLSAQSEPTSTGESQGLLRWLLAPLLSRHPEWLQPADFVLRKTAHATEFAILTLLGWRAGGGRDWARPLALTLAVATLDETHQLFVPGRGPDWRDVLTDLLGGLCVRLLPPRGSLRRLLLLGVQ